MSRDDFPAVPGVEHRFVDVDGMRVHVAEAGSGEPVLLLHGWPQHWYCWRKVVPELSARYRLIMPDLRGFGWSDAPGDGYDPEHFAADAVRVLDALGVKNVKLVGHDWGGVAAFLLALHHPERVAKVLVCNAPHPWARLSLGYSSSEPTISTSRRAISTDGRVMRATSGSSWCRAAVTGHRKSDPTSSRSVRRRSSVDP